MLRRIAKCTLIAFALALGGCKPASTEEGPPRNGATPDAIDYAGWPKLTEKPIPVVVEVWTWCRIPPADDPRVKEAKKLGPHESPAIRVLANPIAHAHLREGSKGPLPVGSIIVKEKLYDIKDEKPVALAAMIKREAGYDPANGDWEYLYNPLRPEGKIERGKLASCIDCHRQAADKDYLFRKYDK